VQSRVAASLPVVPTYNVLALFLRTKRRRYYTGIQHNIIFYNRTQKSIRNGTFGFSRGRQSRCDFPPTKNIARRLQLFQHSV